MGTDVGLQAAIDAYLQLGAPAPEAGPDADGTTNLDIDWTAPLDEPRVDPDE